MRQIEDEMEIELVEARRQIERLRLMCEVLRAERDSARAQVDNLVMQLSSVHALLYPPPTKLQDGRTMVFRPKDPDPHEVLQALSDRIRAIPQKIAAAFKPEAEKVFDDMVLYGTGCSLNGKHVPLSEVMRNPDDDIEVNGS